MLKLLPKFVDKFLVFLVAFLVFLIPFFLLPITTEYYELNKQALLAGLLAIGYSLLALRMLFNRKLILVRTKLDLPIFLLLLICAASAIFSVSPVTSFLGWHGVFHGGVLSLLLYVGLYYLIVNLEVGSGDAEKNAPRASCFETHLAPRASHLLMAVIGSSFILALLAILQYFEIYLFPWDFTHQRFWSPIGGVKTLLVYLLISLPLALGEVVRGRGARRVISALALTGAVGAVFLVSGWGGPLRNFLPEKHHTLPTEVALDWQTSWQIANSVLGTRPIFGSGPGTFFSDFTRFKPQSFNQKPYFNIRFNRPANEWFEIVACLGLAGLIGYLYFWVRVLKLVRTQISTDRSPDQRRLILPLSASLSFFLISTLFYPTTTITSILFWTLLALFVSQAGLTEEVWLKAETVATDFRGKKTIKTLSLGKILASCFLLLASCFTYLYFGRLYTAETNYQKATSEFSQNRERAFNLAFSAAQLNPLVDVYQTGLSTASLGIAFQASQQASPSAQLVQQFVNQAIAVGRKAISLNPENVRNWENLAGLYQNLLQFNPNAEQEVVNSFNQAINLDPASPVLRNQLASFFLRRGKPEEAINHFLMAIRLKQDYAQAHYDLAQAYKAVGNNAQAQQELQTVLLLLPQDSPQRETIDLELQNLVAEEATPSGELE